MLCLKYSLPLYSVQRIDIFVNLEFNNVLSLPVIIHSVKGKKYANIVIFIRKATLAIDPVLKLCEPSFNDII